MTQIASGANDASKRRPGRPRTIDRARILDVARTFDPQTMTMQAVADELGVNRKALSYHVTDREGLLRLVAADAFASHFADSFQNHLDNAGAASVGDWRNTVRAWAFAVRDSVVAAGVVVSYFRITGSDPAVFQPVERVLQDMVGAGFDLQTAGRAVVFLTRFAMGVGRDIVLESETGSHPQDLEVRRLLHEETDGDGYEAFSFMMAAGMNGPGDIATQFEFEIDVFIDGMERRRDPGAATPKTSS